MENLCGICFKSVSEWAKATGYVLTINGKIYHLSCSQNLTIAQVEERMKCDSHGK